MLTHCFLKHVQGQQVSKHTTSKIQYIYLGRFELLSASYLRK